MGEATRYALSVGGVPVSALVSPAAVDGRFRVELCARTAEVVAQRGAVLELVGALAGGWAARFVGPLVPPVPPASVWTRSIGGCSIECGPEWTTVVIGSLDYAVVVSKLLPYEAVG